MSRNAAAYCTKIVNYNKKVLLFGPELLANIIKRVTAQSLNNVYK
jgi:hypothetical protein